MANTELDKERLCVRPGNKHRGYKHVIYHGRVGKGNALDTNCAPDGLRTRDTPSGVLILNIRIANPSIKYCSRASTIKFTF